MKKIALLISIISLFGCSKNPKTKEESLKIDFNKFKLKKTKEKIVKAPYQYIPMDSFKEEEDNQTLKEQYLTSEINFANYYITVSTMCGTGCVLRYIIDTRTGEYYEFPRLDRLLVGGYGN